MSSEQPGVSSESTHDHRNVRFTSHEKINAVLRLLKGESVEIVSRELGVSVSRVERWKGRFVAAGSAELSKRTDDPSKGWVGKHSVRIWQWIWLLVVLAGVTAVLVALVQHRGQD